MAVKGGIAGGGRDIDPSLENVAYGKALGEKVPNNAYHRDITHLNKSFESFRFEQWDECLDESSSAAVSVIKGTLLSIPPSEMHKGNGIAYSSPFRRRCHAREDEVEIRLGPVTGLVGGALLSNVKRDMEDCGLE